MLGSMDNCVADAPFSRIDQTRFWMAGSEITQQLGTGPAGRALKYASARPACASASASVSPPNSTTTQASPSGSSAISSCASPRACRPRMMARSSPSMAIGPKRWYSGTASAAT
ncbi:hypothetical protein D3C87_1664510 [compost metagenome]